MISPREITVSERDDGVGICLTASVLVRDRAYMDRRAMEQSALDFKALWAERLRRTVWSFIYGDIERRLVGCVDTEQAVLDVLKMVRYPQEPVDAVAVERSAERLESIVLACIEPEGSSDDRI